MNEIDDFASPSGDDASSIWLNDLFARTRSPGTADELSSEAQMVDAMTRTIAQQPMVVDITGRRRRDISTAAARTAIVAAALLVGTSTAAATGNLPDAAQSAVSRASSHFGVDIPDPNDDRRSDEHDSSVPTTNSAATDTSAASTSPAVVDDPSAATIASTGVQPTSGDTTSATLNPNRAVPHSTESPKSPKAAAQPGPDLTGPAKDGLCRAWAAHDSDSPAEQSTAMKDLHAAAAAAGQTVEQFCADTPAVPDSKPAESSPTPGADNPAKKEKIEPDDPQQDKPAKPEVDKPAKPQPDTPGTPPDTPKPEQKERDPKGGG
jgi:hypothetical protein